MLQFELPVVTFEMLFPVFSIVFILFGIFAIGWLIIHVEHARHYSWMKVVFALGLGALFLGYGIHFLLLTFGA
ncbi:MAG: hypothetical protein ACTSUB_06045 [Candidatus Thorarchaeota archaeon]